MLTYGSSNALEDNNAQPAAWCLYAWCHEADGVVPWQTLGRGESWQEADPLALFYPGESIGLKGPLPSVRLKSFRQGEQDVEYLTLLAQTLGEPRWAVGEAVLQRLGLHGERQGTGFQGGEDAGRLAFAGLTPQDLWSLRVQVGRMLDRAHPPPRRRLIDFRTPERDPAAAASPEVGRGDRQ